MKTHLPWIFGALALVFCGAPLRQLPASLDPSNPDGPEGAAPKLQVLAEEKKETSSVVVPKGAKESQSRYTCPMHPEVILTTQGQCPQCGMKLVPATASPPASAPAPDHLPEHKAAGHDMHRHGTGAGAR